MPGKLMKKILEEFKENEDDCLSIVDQGISNILEIPELSNLNHPLKNDRKFIQF